jgi:peptide/nickel transport system substrate-binding protein
MKNIRSINHLSRLIAATLVLLVFVSCDFRVERNYKQLVYHIVSEPPSLNPLTHTDAVAGTVLSFIFDSLIERDNETLDFKPQLATRWEISPDHLQYTFYLRDDVYWQDGVKMTVDDIIYSYHRIQDPKVDAAPIRVYYKDVSKVEKIDDYTVRFTYSFPYFRALTMLGGIPIVPKHIFDDGTDFNKNPAGRAPVGNGPYKFKEWKTGRSIVLVKNENYWGAKPAIDGINFRIISDMNVALQVLKKGEIDVASITAIQWVKQTGSKNFNDRFNKYKYFNPNYSYIGWNARRPFFSDARVRRAMTMLLDRQKIREKIYYELPEIVTGNFFKFGPDYNQDIIPFKYDPKEAVRLLDEAGWVDHDGDGVRDKDGVAFSFTFMTSGSRSSEKITNILREELGKIGIEMDITKFEWTVFSKNLHDHAFDATLLAWSLAFESDPYQLWHSSQAERGSNYVGFQNKEADVIAEKARREFNSAKRRGMYRRFHEILHEQQPYLFLFMSPSLVAIQKRFTNIKVYTLGIDIREWGVNKPAQTLYQ